MRVDVTFRNLGSSAPLRGYAVDKVSRLARFLQRPIDGRVILEKDGFRHIAEVSVRDSGALLTATESSQKDMYAAIDLVVDKLKSQAVKRKGKLTNHVAPSAGEVFGRGELDTWDDRHSDLDAELDALGD
jgi:putative sigma-54 modulation protein